MVGRQGAVGRETTSAERLTLGAPLCPPRCLLLPPQERTCLTLSCLDLLAAGIRHLGHGCHPQCRAAPASVALALSESGRLRAATQERYRLAGPPTELGHRRGVLAQHVSRVSSIERG